MREFTVSKNESGQRLDRWLTKTLPALPAPLAQKFLRLKKVKCNGKPARRDDRLQTGDLLQLYINDEFFEQPTEENAFLQILQPDLRILHEDEHILILDKPSGLLCHPDDKEYINTLLTHLQAYLYQNHTWRPREEGAFAPALCNRIDRNTGGIVIAAKTAEALRIMNEKIKTRELSKYYLAVVHGVMKQKSGKLENFLLRDMTNAQVSVHNRPIPNGKTAITHYKVLAESRGLSLVECLLETGRTHQIRTQFAHAGHPLLGDNKYGHIKYNAPFGRSVQALYSYKLVLDFPTDAGILNHLKGKSFQVEAIDFVPEFFPKFKL